MTSPDEIIEAFPELDDITDDDLREKVIAAWVLAVEESGFDHIGDAPWWPPFIPTVGNDERQVPHIQQVTSCAVAIADSLTETRPNLEIDRDVVVAGSLLHDISKLVEIDGDELSELADWLPHPHYSVHLLAEAGLSLEIQNIALSHTELSNVEPKTLEGKIVELADLLVTHATFWDKAGQFKPM